MSILTKLGIGFIGCGAYNSSLARAAERSSLLKPVACWDPNSERSREFAQKHGLHACRTLDELLALDELEGVVIASPNNAHRANAEAAAEAGKHVFVDKPIANTIEDALAIIKAVEGRGLVLAVGHNGRRLAGHRKMKEMIDAGAVGTPVTVESNFSHSGGLGLTPKQWRFYRDECPALPLMQLGVHFADTVQYLLGNVAEVSSFMTHIATPADNDDVTVSLLKFESGVLGYLGSNYASPSVYYVNVYGTDGNLYCEGGDNLHYRKAGSDKREIIKLTGVDTQLEELEDFAEAIRSGRKCEVDGEAGLRALAVVRAALRSNAEGCAVSIDRVISEEAAGIPATSREPLSSH